MDMNILKYMAFLKAVEYGSFTRAAEALNYSQSGVSRMIHDLEKEWNITLLERGRSGIRLTSDGSRMLPYAQSLCSEYQKLQMQVDDLHGVQSGIIRIGTFSSGAIHWVPNIIKAFQKDYPHVEIQIIEGGSDTIEEIMTSRQAELCLYAGGEGKGFEWIPLRRDRLRALVPPDHPLSRKKAVPLEALLNEEFIMPMPGYDGEVRFILDKLPHWPHILFSACSDYAIINMVAEGLGVSILPDLQLENYSHKAVALPMEPPQERTLGLGVPQMKTASPVTQNFIQYVKRYVEGMN